jgi:hypothetical protein
MQLSGHKERKTPDIYAYGTLKNGSAFELVGDAKKMVSNFIGLSQSFQFDCYLAHIRECGETYY